MTSNLNQTEQDIQFNVNQENDLVLTNPDRPIKLEFTSNSL